MLVKQTTIAMAADIVGVSDADLRSALSALEYWPVGWLVTNRSSMELCYTIPAIVGAVEWLVRHGSARASCLSQVKLLDR